MTLKDDIKAVLELALRTPGSVHVVRAAPGQGKTHNTIEVMAELMNTGQVQRVLWAVRETRAKDSLGQEAVKRMRAAGLNVRVLLSRQDALLKAYTTAGSWHAAAKTSGKARYKAQFDWGMQPEVKIISHAHLPLVYGKDARSKGGQHLSPLRQAELLVVDEDPSDVFLLDQGVITQGRNKNTKRNLRLNSVFFESRKDLISMALSTLLTQAMSGSLDDQAEVWGRPGRRTYSMSGAAFWQALSDVLPPNADWNAFADTLGQAAYFKYKTGISPWVVHQMRRALHQFRAGKAPSAQYGLTWPEKRDGSAALDVQFRFNISQYRPIPCSMVVLDAYAHPAHYGAVFRPSPAQIHPVGDEPELKVTVASGAGRNRNDVVGGKREEHVLALMERVVSYAGTHGSTLLLSYKDSKSAYQTALYQALALRPLLSGVEVELQHWRAGRGSNNWEGWNVIALEEFSFPQEYARLSLTALVPAATGIGQQERDQLWQLHGASENLQMFHRSRQTLAARHGWPRTPDVITLYEPEVAELQKLGRISTVASNDLFTKPSRRTTRPRFNDVVGKCAAELTILLGAVPLLTFTALGLEERRDQVAEITRQHIKAKIQLLLAISTEPLPLLRGWSEKGMLPGYESVGLKRRTSRTELVQAVQNLDPTLLVIRDVRPAQTAPGLRRVPNTVMATSAARAQEAVDLLFSHL